MPAAIALPIGSRRENAALVDGAAAPSKPPSVTTESREGPRLPIGGATTDKLAPLPIGSRAIEAREDERKPLPPAEQDRVGSKDSSSSAHGGRFLDKYTLGHVLGQGAFGIVYICIDRHSTKECAVKMVDKVETPGDAIEREVELQRNLGHPNIVRVHDVFFEKCFVCIVMDLCHGGDLIQGIESYWDARGKLECFEVVHVGKQMLSAVEFLHSVGIAHRDIKADNYLLDRGEIADPECRVCLGDFGAACEVQQDERMDSVAGTRSHWAPEVFSGNYGLKADVWALGVVMYGLFEGNFPFSGDLEDEVRHKEVCLGDDAPSEYANFVRCLLSKEESERPNATEALTHPYLTIESARSPSVGDIDMDAEAPSPYGRFSIKAQAGVVSAPVGPLRGCKSESTPRQPALMKQKSMPLPTAALNINLREEGANAHVQERRKELITRMEGAAARLRGLTLPSSGKVEGSPATRWSDPTFYVRDRRTGAERSFEWVMMEGDDEEAWTSLLPGGTTDQRRKNSICHNEEATEEETQQAVAKTLSDHGIDIAGFGLGTARTLTEFAAEVQNGEARLMLDATRHKKLVRVVDLVLLRVHLPEADAGAAPRILVESGLKYADGRTRSVGRLPGGKKRPHENARRAASRLLQAYVNMADSDVSFDFHKLDVYEEEDDSPSYPGVHTVYRKEIIDGVVRAEPETLARITSEEGLVVEDPERGITRTYEWVTPEACADRGFTISRPENTEDFSGLVQAPVGFDEGALHAYLESARVDMSQFGKDVAKTVDDLATELIKGESTLMLQADGSVLRVVDMVVLRLRKADSGEVLVESPPESRSGLRRRMERRRLPGDKRRPDENIFLSARRILWNRVGMSDNYVAFEARRIKVIEDVADSPSYPGLKTLYRKRIVSGEVQFPQDGTKRASGANFKAAATVPHMARLLHLQDTSCSPSHSIHSTMSPQHSLSPCSPGEAIGGLPRPSAVRFAEGT